MDDEVEGNGSVPRCPADGMRMSSTIVGWRCPICGLVRLPEVA
jgi:tRNA(Ile2) C34 agmatinyltransferase TiaS